MSELYDQPSFTRRAAADLEKHRLVKQDANGEVVLAGAANTDEALGTTLQKVATGELVGIRMPQAGFLKCCASAAIAINAVVVQAANGKIQTSAGLGAGTYRRIGVAMNAAGADGDIISINPIAFGDKLVVP